ncbi:MAG: c-type cytochrome, partial [Akkermansiaceae bacterium]
MKLIIYRQFLIHALDFVVVLKKACKPRGIYFITMTSSLAKKTTFLRLLAVSLTLAATPCDAEDGKALYTTYCSACHGIDGKGANNGAFPPLAKSPWVSGEPSRVIQIVLHCLQG